MDQAVKARPTIALDSVESSQLHSIGYHPETQTLAIQFLNKEKGPGSLYHYENFTQADWDEFRNAVSFGSHFKKFIKPNAEKYPYTRIE